MDLNASLKSNMLENTQSRRNMSAVNSGWITVFNVVWFYQGNAKNIYLWQNSRHHSYSR